MYEKNRLHRQLDPASCEARQFDARRRGIQKTVEFSEVVGDRNSKLLKESFK